MGQIVSLVTQVINFATKAKAEADREKNRKLQKEADKLSNPIKPPQFWPTISARRKNVPKGPYSVEGIRLSLDNLTLPAGWSEEQLIQVGFRDEVAEYRKGVDSEQKDLFSSFGQTLAALAKAVNTELTGEDVALKSALRKAGVTQSVVNKFNNLSKDAVAGKLEPAAVNSAISELRTLLDKTQLEKDIAADVKESQKQISDAADSRNSAVLAIVRRAIGVKAAA
jgi:hypothetical protein